MLEGCPCPELALAVPNAAAVVLAANGFVGAINKFGSGGGGGATPCINLFLIRWSVLASTYGSNLLFQEADWSAFGLGTLGAGGVRLCTGDRITVYHSEMESAPDGWG